MELGSIIFYFLTASSFPKKKASLRSKLWCFDQNQKILCKFLKTVVSMNSSYLQKQKRKRNRYDVLRVIKEMELVAGKKMVCSKLLQ